MQVLLVEPDTVAGRLIRETVDRHAGHRVRLLQVSTLEQAEVLLACGPLHLILLDVEIRPAPVNQLLRMIGGQSAHTPIILIGPEPEGHGVSLRDTCGLLSRDRPEYLWATIARILKLENTSQTQPWHA
ncbi:MAG: response regulator [Gemmatimonadales bacterium]